MHHLVLGTPLTGPSARACSQRHPPSTRTQLNTDVVVYNDMNEGKVPEIQIILDFSEDVAERQQQ